MSMYNMLFRRNPVGALLLAALDLDEGSVGRFRDCYLTKWGGASEADRTPHIAVYTRNGGGNRDDYADVTERLQAHPCYADDFDDEFDQTYATYIFKVPESCKPMIEKLIEHGAADGPSPEEKFKQLLEDLRTGNDADPAVQRAMRVGQEVLSKLLAATP